LIQWSIRKHLIHRTDGVMKKANAITRQTDRDISSQVREILISDYKAQGKYIWATVNSCPCKG